MTGTDTNFHNRYTADANLDICHLDITGTVTHKQIGDTSGGFDVLGHCSVTGTLTQDNDENLRLYGNNVSNKPKLFVPQALDFDGTDDYVTMGDVTILDGEGAFSLSAWVKFDNKDLTDQRILWKDDAFGLGYFSGQLRGYMYYSGGDTNAQASHTVTGMWTHVAMTYDGSTITLYVNGSSAATASISSKTVPNTSNALRIGGLAGSTKVAGMIADCRVYDTNLDATEIATLAENILPNQARTDNLVGHWKLDETSGTTAIDSAGSNNGTHTNSPTKVGNRTTAVAGVNRIYGYGPTTTYIPECTTEKLFCQTGTTISTGDLTVTGELQVANTVTYNANGNTITPNVVDVHNGGTLNLTNSTLNFYSGSGDSWTMGETSTLATGNTTVTGANAGSPAGTPIYMPTSNASSSNFEIVGDVSLLVSYGETDLTVIGSVTNCTKNSDGSIIRQFFHTLDTQQLLDADSAGDDDLRLSKPALDNTHELQTG